MKRSRKETIMFLYILYLEGKAIYKGIKTYKTLKKLGKDIEEELKNLDWDEVVRKANEQYNNNVVVEQ